MVTFIRPGIVHSLGSGCCVLEPQEPSDWNILAEWEGYPFSKEDAHCGSGWDLALDVAEFTKLDESTAFRPIFNHGIRFKTPIAYLTTGQKVPEDIETASKERLVDLLLNISGN